MINTIHGEKPIAPSTERSSQSSKNVKSEQTIGQTPSTEKSTTAEPVSSTVEIDKARHLYELESQKSSTLDSTISSPKEARSLLNKILDQFSSSPEQALQSQGSRYSSALANLLQTEPA